MSVLTRDDIKGLLDSIDSLDWVSWVRKDMAANPPKPKRLRCQYCETLQPDKVINCPNCGAPR